MKVIKEPHINRNITNINHTVFKTKRNIEFIVIHYFGAFGSAEDNTKYFKDVNRKASAHYFVDDNSIWQCVEDNNAAWHCGGKNPGKFQGVCTNNNSIGVEMRPYKLNPNSKDSTDNDWYFHESTVDNTINLVRYLMDKYNVDIYRVIRHFDVTGKLCPRPYVGDDINQYYHETGNSMWEIFKNRLQIVHNDTNNLSALLEVFNRGMDLYLQGLALQEPSEWSEESRKWAEENGLIRGTGDGVMEYGSFVTREQMVEFMKRLHDWEKRVYDLGRPR